MFCIGDLLRLQLEVSHSGTLIIWRIKVTTYSVSMQMVSSLKMRVKRHCHFYLNRGGYRTLYIIYDSSTNRRLSREKSVNFPAFFHAQTSYRSHGRTEIHHHSHRR